MSVKERVMTCRLLEKMMVRGNYGKQLGLENASTFCGMNVIPMKDVEKKLQLHV